MKTIKTWAIMALAMGMAFPFSSCDKEDKDPAINTAPLDNYEKIGTRALSDGGEATLYFGEAPFVGYNKVAVKVTAANGKVVDDATVSLRPMMDMGTMMHTTPKLEPVFDFEMDAYMGSSTFIMPSTMMQRWTMGVLVQSNEQPADTLSFEIEVAQRNEARLYSCISAVDSTTYFVALKEPFHPTIGINDFELMIYKRESMMSFPPVSDLKVEIEPIMPAMNHGSPNNENPVHVENGLYAGKVNFTMTGFWRVNIRLKDAHDALVHEGYLDITFQ